MKKHLAHHVSETCFSKLRHNGKSSMFSCAQSRVSPQNVFYRSDKPSSLLASALREVFGAQSAKVSPSLQACYLAYRDSYDAHVHRFATYVQDAFQKLGGAHGRTHSQRATVCSHWNPQHALHASCYSVFLPDDTSRHYSKLQC